MSYPNSAKATLRHVTRGSSCSRWADVLVFVKPETVIGWHRAGFRLNWRWRSQARGGRPKITEGIRTLIRRLAEENPDWGAVHSRTLHQLTRICE
jgi:hypothetical protein